MDTSYLCTKCGKAFKNKAGLQSHIRSCGNKKIKSKIKIVNICPKCGMEIYRNFDKHLKSCNGLGPRRRRKKVSREYHCDICGKLFTAKSGYLSHKRIIHDKIKQKYVKPTWDEETEVARRKKISETAKKNKISGGYREGSGVGKKGRYGGYWCDSSWELAYVIYNLDHKIPFRRNTEKFDYTFEGVEKKYIPDFILEDGTYVEIKGFMTKQVKAKLKAFKHNIILYGEQEMQPILDYVVNRYGRDFIKLYERRVPRDGA